MPMSRTPKRKATGAGPTTRGQIFEHREADTTSTTTTTTTTSAPVPVQPEPAGSPPQSSEHDALQPSAAEDNVVTAKSPESSTAPAPVNANTVAQPLIALRPLAPIPSIPSSSSPSTVAVIRPRADSSPSSAPDLAADGDATEPQPKRRKGRVVGSQSFKKSDKMLAFAAIREVKPTASYKWEAVAEAYSRSASLAGRRSRSAEWLQKWFGDLCREGLQMEKAGESDAGELQWDVAEARRIVSEIEGIGGAIGTGLPDVAGSDDDAPPQRWRRAQSDNVGDESMDGHETEGHPTPAPTWLSHYVPSIGRQRTPSTVSGSLNQTMSPQIPSSSIKGTNPFHTATPKLAERLARRESNISNVHSSGTADQQHDRVIVVEAPGGHDTIAIIEAVTRPLKEALERTDQRADRYETELEKLRAENWELKTRLQRYEAASS